MTQQVSYAIWASIASQTKAFDLVRLKINPTGNRIFVSIGLRWWAKLRKLEKLRSYWLKKAHRAAAEFAPKGWRLIVFYEGVTSEVRQGPASKNSADPYERDVGGATASSKAAVPEMFAARTEDRGLEFEEARPFDKRG